MEDTLEDGFTLYWRIENFYISETSPSTVLKSQSFTIPLFDNKEKPEFTSWYLILLHSCSKLVGLFLCIKGSHQALYFRLKMSVLTTSGWVLCAKGVCKSFKQSTFTSYTTFVRGTPQLIKWNKRNPVKKYLSNGCLTVSCQMSNFSTRNQYEQCLIISEMISDYKLLHTSLLQFNSLKPSDLLNFSSSFTFSAPCPSCTARDNSVAMSVQTESTDDTNEFKDPENFLRAFTEKSVKYVFLRTASKDFAVSKALLCASSPVFNDMLQWRRSIYDNNIINIDDIDDGTVSLLLQFLHLEPIEDLGLYAATKLFHVADKYQINPLKMKCRSFMKRKRSRRK